MSVPTLPSPAVRLARWALCAVLAVLSLGYAAKGFQHLVLSPEPPTDFHLRWIETRYFLAGRNPNDTYLETRADPALWRPLWRERPTAPLAEYGPPPIIGYPGWAMVTGLLSYFPREIQAARWYFAAWNVAALAVLFAFGWGVGIPFGQGPALTLALSGTAVSAISTALGIGQCSVLLTAFLALGTSALRRGHPAVAGLWLGLAAAKPILSAPFGLAFLVPFRPRALAAVAGLLLLTSAAAWWLTQANPLEVLAQMARGSQTFVADSYGPLNLLLALGLPLTWAEIIAAGVCIVAAAVLTARWRGASALVHAAIAAVAARLWTYHHLYDNVVLLFLLLALGELAARRPETRTLLAFAAVGLSLWAPGKLCDHLAFQLYQTVVWIGGLAFLLGHTSRAEVDRSLA